MESNISRNVWGAIRFPRLDGTNNQIALQGLPDEGSPSPRQPTPLELTLIHICDIWRGVRLHLFPGGEHP